MAGADVGTEQLDHVETLLRSLERRARLPHQVVFVDNRAAFSVWARSTPSPRTRWRVALRSSSRVGDLHDLGDDGSDVDALRLLDAWNAQDRVGAAALGLSRSVAAGVTVYSNGTARDAATAAALLAAASAYEVAADGPALRERCRVGAADPGPGLRLLTNQIVRLSAIGFPPTPYPPTQSLPFSAPGLAVTTGDAATLHVDTRARHRHFGSGVSLVLELPVAIADRDLGVSVAASLNDAEVNGATGVPGYGAWYATDDRRARVAHRTFLPNVVVRLIGLPTLIDGERSRATWAECVLAVNRFVGLDADRCAACAAPAVRFARVLQIAADLRGAPAGMVPQGGLDEHVDGHLPLCPDCLPACASCGQPWRTDPVRRLLQSLEPRVADGRVHLRWWVEPCDDPSHTPERRGDAQ